VKLTPLRILLSRSSPQHNCQQQYTYDNLLEKGKRVHVDAHLLAELERFIFHDGLTAWWEADAQEHMRSLGFGDRQLRILPANNSKVASYYQNGLAGNSPEMCRGLDASRF